MVLRLRLCGGVQVEADDSLLPDALLAGRQGRLVLAYLACERHRAVPREELADLLWSDRLPDSWPASLSAVISRLRRLLGHAGLDGATALRSSLGSYQLDLPDDTRIDWEIALAAVEAAEHAVAAQDATAALEAAAEAAAIAGRGFLTDDCAWVDAQREAVRDVCVRAALATSEAHLLAGSPTRAVEAARDALAQDVVREAGYRLLMRALAAAGERGEALRTWERCRATLVDELGTDPSPATEAVYLEILGPAGSAATQSSAVTTELPSGVVTFLLTDIVESSALWDREPAAMAAALERHDSLVAEVVQANSGTLLKSKLEGDATVSVFRRATAGATAALALRDALHAEPWPEGAQPRVRMALHTGEAFERGGDYFGPALNRAARLRSLAGGAQILLSQAVAELVRDHLPEGVALVDRGHRDLRGLSRGENVYELAPIGDSDETSRGGIDATLTPLVAPPVPAALTPSGPFVGRSDELVRLSADWERAVGGKPAAMLLGGEPGVGKSRLAAECARVAHDQGAVVLYGRCDEEIGAPFQPFVEAVRSIVPALGPERLRGVRGVDELSRLMPELADLVPGVTPAVRADPDTERYALFDAITQLLVGVSVDAPVLLVLDDLHWAGKTTLTLLRHLLRNAESARLLVIGTYRDTELARTHALAATLADLRGDGTADRITLSGLAPDDITAYLHAIGHDDRALGRELAKVTSGNPFFLIETLRHVEECGGTWEPGSLPQGVREATGRRLSRLSDAANEALSIAAVAGSSFALDLVENIRGADLVDEIVEACQAGLVIEEPGSPGAFRFAHALVRQVLLAELVTVKRVRLHRTIAELLEANPGPDPDAQLADLAHHWFECASTGAADKAVAACRQAADRALERLAYEEAADLYGMAIQALEATDGEDADVRAELHLARCDALLTSGEVIGARAALEALRVAAEGSDRLRAWHTTFAGQLTVLAEPQHLTEIVESVGDAARAMREAGDLVGEAKAHYVHALALERLGQIGAAERALDAALAAARGSGDRRLADAILAEAPPAALWGPSPVTRASGRCLDVVRVLRITAGAPAVEAVALRCQAVLEGLRGRMDAARRMVASALRTVDQLGLTHRRLETEVAAGLIELLDGEASAAESHLRTAYEELRDRGLGGEAAQAAALLGRALLLQQRDEEAEAVAREAETLAGADLKAAIAWRGVLAEAAARRGETGRALELARAAVDLATATDALLLVADARLSLAAVLRATGDGAAADAEALRAVEACEAKGATVLAARARAGVGSTRDVTAPRRADERGESPTSQAGGTAADLTTGVEALGRFENAATRRTREFQDAFNHQDWSTVESLYSPEYRVDDRRRVRGSSLDNTSAMDVYRTLFELGGRYSIDVIATRGEWMCLVITRVVVGEHGGESLFDSAGILEADAAGFTHQVVFDLEDIDTAWAEFDRRYRDTLAPEARSLHPVDQPINNRDWDTLRDGNAPDLTVIDHRPGRLGAITGRDTLVDFYRATVELSPDVRLRLFHERVRGPFHLGVISVAGSIGGGPIEAGGLTIWELNDEGRTRRLEFFQDTQLDDAFARFDSLSADAAVPDRFENAAVRFVQEFVAAFNGRDWDRVEQLNVPDLSIDDRRPLVGTAYEHETGAHNYRLLFGGGVRFSVRVIATRGERLALVLTHLDMDSGADLDALTVVEVDDDGRCLELVHFEPDDLESGFAALDHRHALLEPDAPVPFGAHDPLNRREWDALRSELAPDVVVEDHRPAGTRHLVGRDAFVEFYRSTIDLLPDAHARLHHLLASGRARLGIAALVGTLDGGPFEMRAAIVWSTDTQGRVARMGYYDEEQLSDAFTRYDAIIAAEYFENDATRAAYQFSELFNDRHWDRAMALLSPTSQFRDHRILGMSGDIVAGTHTLRFLYDGGGFFSTSVIASRGEGLALMRTTVQTPTGGAEAAIEFLGLLAFREGAFQDVEFFDPDDLDAAFAELDRLDEESSGESMADLQRAIEDAPVRLQHVKRRHHVRIAQFDTGDLCTWLVDERGEIRELEVHGDDLDGAFGRFDELTTGARTTPSTHGVFDNLAVRYCNRFVEAFRADDWERIRALYTDEFRIDDRRTLVGVPLDLDSTIGGLQFLAELDTTLDVRALATRGTSHCLAVLESRSEEAEGDILNVITVAADGRCEHAVSFDPDAVDEAYEELDRRYLAGEGADAAWYIDNGLTEAWKAHDWDAARDRFSPDFVVESHQALGLVVARARDEYVEWLRALSTEAPDLEQRLRHVLAADRDHVLTIAGVEGSRAGGRFEIFVVALAQRGSDGRLGRFDIYDLDQLDEARAHYDELTAARSAVEPFANLAVAGTDRFVEAWNTRDWDRVAATCSDDYRGIDRRGFAHVEMSGTHETYRGLFTLGWTHQRGRLLATRGDRLALLYRTLSSPEDDEVADMLAVEEVDTEGIRTATVAFDPGNIDGAYEELDRRYATAEGADAAWFLGAGFLERFWHRDWDAVRELFSPEFTLEDHLPLGLIRSPSAEEYVASLRALVAEAPDAKLVLRHVLAYTTRAALLIAGIDGTREGGAFEMTRAFVIRRGKQAPFGAFHMYDMSQLHDAHTRFDELVRAQSAVTLSADRQLRANTAFAVVLRRCAALFAGDLDTANATGSRSIVVEERQALARAIYGYEGFAETNRSARGATFTTELRATAGDRLCLTNVRASRGADSFEVERLGVFEVDEGGRLVAITIFDADDELEAHRELQQRFLAGEAAQFVDSAGAVWRFLAALLDHDVAAVRQIITSDAIVDDRRRFGFGLLEGIDAYLDALRAIRKLAPDVGAVISEWLRVENWGAVAIVKRVGDLPDGGETETDFVAMCVASGGRIARFELYDVPELDTALARFEELRQVS